MASDLSKSILTTVAYYDILDYPLTAFEIWKYLLAGDSGESFELGEVIKALEKEGSGKAIEEYRGFYFLRGRKELVEQRIERNKISETKYRIIKKVVFWLRFVPYVRMVAVTGRMAMKNASLKSDLDLLIVLKHGRIFTGRTLVTFLVHILGKRRYGDKITNRVCLNYFITDQSLEISLKDLFSSSEYSFILPMFGRKIFRRFQKENGWIRKYKPNYGEDGIFNLKMISDSPIARAIRYLGESLLGFDLLEKSLKKWQIERISKDPRTKKDGSIIIADDESLVFLPEPQGPKQNIRFREKMSSLLTKV
jgi:hypothetical protein